METDSPAHSNVAPLAWLALAAACLGVLATAAWLDPDPRGYGTHAQLGLPPCGFRWLTGLACPGCGLTTAFAHAIRGEWALSSSANPLGLALFFCVVACVPIAVFGAARGWSLGAAIDRFRVGHWALAVAGCATAVWVVRVARDLLQAL